VGETTNPEPAAGFAETISQKNMHFFSKEPPKLPTAYSSDALLGLFIPFRNNNFTGRVDSLQAIEQGLANAQQSVLIHSVVGLGGIGKTQLAVEYVYQSIEKKRYGHILWLNGSNPLEAYKALGNDLHIQFEPNESEDLCIKKVERLLKSSDFPLLLVWDDAKDYTHMLPYLASATRLKAHCLITSRAQYWAEDVSLISLEVFSKEEALAFLRQRFLTSAGLYDEVAAKTLAHTVGYLPLALAQAAAYVLMRRKTYLRTYSLNDYLSAYANAQDDTKKEFFNNKLLSVQDNYINKTVWTTWYLSIQALKTENPQAVNLIEQCAYLDEREIQDRLLSLLSDTSEDEVRRSIEALLAYSLVERLVDNHLPAIKIHQLLQDVIRLHLKEEPLSSTIPLSLPELEDATQQEQEPIPEALMIRRYLTDKTNQWLWSQREVAFHLQSSNPLLSSGELEEARAQKESPAAALIKLVIPALHNNRNHQLVASLLKRLDKTFNYDERHMEHLRAVQVSFAPHVKAVCDHALKAEVGEPVAIGLLFHLGGSAHYLKDAKEMQKIYQIILPYCELYYSNHPLLARALGGLGNAYGDLGDPQEKQRLLQRALAIQELYYGVEHVEVANTLNNFATAYGALGNHQEKKRLLQRALEIQEHYYGSEHAAVARTLTNLANAYGSLGDPQEQKRLLQRALVIKEHYYDAEHVEVAITLSNLATAFGALGDPQEQKRLLQRVLAIFERDYGLEHVAVARTLNNLANACGDLGNHQEKKCLLLRALGIQELYYGPEHVEVARTLNNLANAYGAVSEPQEQKRLLQRALPIRESYYGPEHAEVACTLTNLASAYGALGDYQEKKRLLLRALQIDERYYGPEHVEVASTLYNLANAYGALGDHKESKRLLQRALLIKERDYGPEHEEVARILGNLASAYGALGELPSAQNNFQRALLIKQHFFGEAHPEVGMIFLNLAALHFQQKEFSLGLAYLKQAHAIFLRHPNCGPTHPYTQKAIAQLNQLAPNLSLLESEAQQYTHLQHTGDQALQNKDYSTAIKHWQIALPFVTVQSFISPPKKLDAILLYEQLGNAHREQGELDKAIANFTQAQTHLTYLREQQSEVYLRIASKKSACEIKLAANLAHQIGVTHYKAGNWAQALIAFQEGLEKNQRFFGEQFHADIALSYWCLSSCYLQQEDYNRALGHVEKAYLQRHALFGESAELTQKAKERLTLCREKIASSPSHAPVITLKP
jgi:tetratricopeptide (TPR) repeat protein